ncbi:hypothetical protein Cgig2_008952 [Carnegiea gigantea]|uniref:Aminotransferase-like plant mobile domain-containing protein n=1 Tax=Carnegiea gigantea TaxID=171969 RepID=A0A9Q1JNH4_9CARY|nr:hypothetical protein Cgig2_008952 [Carnegiea gigantea]
MVTFVDKITNGRRYLHIQPSENDVDGEETKLPVRKPITSLCKPDCVRGPPSLPWWSKENLKTGETFLLSTHVKMKENLPSYQLLRHDIESERRSWAKLPLHGEFSYKPLYWEWLEGILVHCKDKLTTLHLFDALYASLFLYDRCSNLIRTVCEYWYPETNTLHTSKGEVSPSIFDIYSFLRLPISGCLCDEVVPTQRELASKLPLSYTYLFIAYHKLIKYHVSKKPDQDSRIPQPGILSSLTDAEARGWSDYQAIFDELGVATGQRTETLLTAFFSCWLCTFILPVRDAGCIRPGSQVLLPRRCNLLETNTTRVFREWWPKMFVSPPCSPHASGSKRKRSDLSGTNISKDEGKLKPKLKIVRSGTPVEPFVPAMEDGSSRVKIPGIDIGTLATPIPAIPIQSIAPLPQITNEIEEPCKYLTC